MLVRPGSGKMAASNGISALLQPRSSAAAENYVETQNLTMGDVAKSDDDILSDWTAL